MKSLVVYYSLTGKTRLVASKLAALLDTETEALVPKAGYEGGLGLLKAVWHILLGRKPAIEPLIAAPDAYDLVVVAGPIWAGRIASPVQSFLQSYHGRFKSAAFCVTHGGTSPEKTFRQMQALSGIAPIATLAVKEKDIGEGRYDLAVRTFADQLREELARRSGRSARMARA